MKLKIAVFWSKCALLMLMFCYAFVKGNSGWGGLIEVTCATAMISVASIVVQVFIVDVRDLSFFFRSMITVFHCALALAAVLAYFANWKVVEAGIIPNGALWSYWKHYAWYFGSGIVLLSSIFSRFYFYCLQDQGESSNSILA